MAHVQAVTQTPRDCCDWVCEQLLVCWVTNRAENWVFPLTVSGLCFFFFINTSLKRLFWICVSFVAWDCSRHSFSSPAATALCHSHSLGAHNKRPCSGFGIWAQHEMNLSCYSLKSLIMTLLGWDTYTHTQLKRLLAFNCGLLKLAPVQLCMLRALDRGLTWWEYLIQLSLSDQWIHLMPMCRIQWRPKTVAALRYLWINLISHNVVLLCVSFHWSIAVL